MRGWWVCLCAALVVQDGGAQDAVSREDGYSARVTRVFDGDTLWVRPLAGGRYRKLRLEGIDAPEICQRGGETARNSLARRVLNQVVLVREISQDDYGRGIARIEHQGDDVAAWMVAQGQAWSYRWRRSPRPFAQEERAARQSRLGVFVEASPERPGAFRKRHGPCPMPPRG